MADKKRVKPFETKVGRRPKPTKGFGTNISSYFIIAGKIELNTEVLR